MSVRVTWLGHASFRISSGEAVVYIDPWKLDSEAHDADLVVISHSHYDHCAPDDVVKVSRPETVVVGPDDSVGQFEDGRVLRPGQDLESAGAIVRAVPAYNIGKRFHAKDNDWIGAVVTLGGKRVYYAGDTDLIPEMSGLERIDLALLPVGGTFTMNSAEAARACDAIGCKAALPYHWGDIVGEEADANAFAEAAPCQVHLIQPGGQVSL